MEEVERDLETEPHLVVALERNRGWLALQYHIAQRRQGRERVLVHAILRSQEPVDQRRVDYERGYMDALAWMTGLPEKMKARLREGGESAE